MSSTEIRMVRAAAVHSARLTQIAHAAKSYWGYPAHWIELWHNQLTVSPGFIEANEVWAAEVDGMLLGFYALTGEAPQLSLDHMWVFPVAIGQGIGRELFAHALVRASALGASSLEIEADPNAQGFYERMGAVTVGEVAYLVDGLRRALPLMEIQVEGAPAPKHSDAASGLPTSLDTVARAAPTRVASTRV
jgi:GNAT superfamily N-acetyltransferase